MAGSLTLAELKDRLAHPARITQDAFNIAKSLAAYAGQTETESRAHDLVLRALEHRDAFGSAVSVLEALVRQIGLFPYLEEEELGFADAIAYEYHRPLNMDADNVVFHRVQAAVYNRLMDGDNVVLSAPTSFGKSLIIDAIIASGCHANIAVVVPTIALIDETRRRLSRFSPEFKIITHPSQQRAQRNLLVMTQERILELKDLAPLDFFVIDEFYKLQPRPEDSERSYLLNQAFYRLYKTGAQFYLLGPNIRGLDTRIKDNLEFRFMRTDYKTVVSEVHTLRPSKGDEEPRLVDLCQGLREPTLIYCSSPARVRKVVAALLEGGVVKVEPQLSDAAEWIGIEYSPDWLFGKALHHGVGMHHGRLPRTLAQYAVRAFNNELVRFLVCTSTFIEGVNTKAKNVIVFDNKIARRKVDYFTYNNILGRSGRMFQHFVGKVWIFHEPPPEELPFVDFPAFSQPDDTPASLLMQIDEEDLRLPARRKMAELYEESELDREILRQGTGIDPDAQNRLARALRERSQLYWPSLHWSGPPRYEELRTVCELIWEYLVPDKRRRAGVSSGKQLAYKINQFRRSRGMSTFMQGELETDADRADEIVEETMDFLRSWANFWFPRYLMAVDRIQKSVFAKLGRPSGDYGMFAGQVENWFLDPAIMALDEYGVPIQVGQKLEAWLRPDGDLDGVLERLKALAVAEVGLTPFERLLVEDARRHL